MRLRYCRKGRGRNKKKKMCRLWEKNNNMSKNQKVAKYLQEKGIKTDWNPEYMYIVSKSLDFKLWDLNRSWKEFINTLKKLFK